MTGQTALIIGIVVLLILVVISMQTEWVRVSRRNKTLTPTEAPAKAKRKAPAKPAKKVKAKPAD